jgi:hypothetical protein
MVSNLYRVQFLCVWETELMESAKSLPRTIVIRDTILCGCVHLVVFNAQTLIDTQVNQLMMLHDACFHGHASTYWF